jgi:hypothetical protein
VARSREKAVKAKKFMKANGAGVKLISLLLSVGGAVGVGVSLWALSHAASLKEAVLTVGFAGRVPQAFPKISP